MKNFCGRVAGLSLVTMIVFCGPAGASTAVCTTTDEDKVKVVEAMQQMYVAATKDDLDGFHKVAAAEFFAFDGGKRFDGDALMNLIKTAHDAGKRYEWKVTEPEVHLTCNDAWIAYTNRGSLQDESGTKSLTWLESAFLHKEGDVWKIQFFHSTRVP
ncbi:MAG TPA: nuclear transport factor 2 family protein [Edaphobacter sp.]